MALTYIANAPIMKVSLSFTASQTLSSEVVLGEQTVIALDHTSTMGAKTLYFRSANTSGGTAKPVYNDAGSQYSITLDTSGAHRVILDPAELAAMGPVIKVAQNTAGAGTVILYAAQIYERGKGY